ncbi:hypothetical protein [Paracoccus sp. SCN 68-21]|nr:hypothetical protein [Paracoccus sp. SCN 68-21]ODT58005.1 MAG: hypothetical protein ABS73_14970 [Paracoccus sp. SCN 68-21]
MLEFAVDEEMISSDPSDPSDPSAGVKAQRGEVKSHRQWTTAELAKFRQHLAAMTRGRIAFEVIYRTGARCVDAVGLGWQRVDGDGWPNFVQAKTGGPATCPGKTLPQWAESPRAERALFLASVPRDRMIWIMT